MRNDDRSRKLDFLCSVAARSAADLSIPERITLYEAIALFSSDQREAAQADYTAFLLQEAERAQQEMTAILRAR